MERVDVQVPASAYPTIKRTLMDDLENHRKESNGLKYYIPVITGFIAKNDQNKICTLGRGGSDFTAALLGVSLVAREIQIWTDTDGVLTGDPRIVDEPLHIEHMAFEEAEELAYFGAKILHPRSIQAPKRLGIPIRVKNTYNPSHCGTLISSVPSLIKRNQFLLTALTLKSPVILVDIRDNRMLGQYGFLAKVFSVFKTLKISIDVIATSEVSVSISLDKDTPIERVEALQDSLFQTAEINILGERSIIALIGNKSRAAEGLEIACNTLARMNVPLEMVSLGASKLNASLIIQKERSNETVRALHSAFFNHVDRHSEKIAN